VAQSTPDDRRFRWMYDAHVDAVRRYFYRRLPASEVDDATIEVFMVVWRRLDSVPKDDGALPWIYGIARNVLRNQQRSDRRRTRLVGKLGRLGARTDPAAEVQVIQRIEDREMLAAVQELRPADREILLLAAWEGLAPRQIGAVLGIDPHAASMRLQRARSRFARILGTPARTEARPHPKAMGGTP
jgi:RNA polymerase sigma-70 factor (ECF subfamily)